MKQRPVFITFEGCEASGKTTQSKLLLQWFQKNNINAILTREPGGTSTAEQIRKILLDDNTKLDIRSQLLLHFVSRIEHVTEVIKPALSKNIVVICDRFFDSTVAYQHYGHGLNLDFMKKMHMEFLDNIIPDITFILNIDFSLYKKRISQKINEGDRYENLPDNYHKKVIAGFQKIAALNSNRCHIIDSAQEKDKTHISITEIISQVLQ